MFMIIRRVTMLAVVLYAAAGLAAEELSPRSAMMQAGPPVRLTGNLRVDLLAPGLPALEAQDSPADGGDTPGRKSPWLAAGLSLIIPGAGELYAESYWKAALFFAVDVAAWTVAYTQDKKGDDQTAFYQSYANEHWDVGRYATWSYNNSEYINPSLNAAPYADMFMPDGGINWDRLNEYERALGNWYSHTLPPYGAQQYFELIGKYQQFYHGWDDANPALLTYDQITAELSPNFTYYSEERGKANDYYNNASTAVTVAVINRVISALDAAWSAASYNSNLEAQMSMHTVPYGTGSISVPAARIAYRF
jgi:hypothetical protein